jgi:uncharacterized protein YqjF (DUF2071 family)
MQMQWLDLAFLHWPVPVQVLRPMIPAGLEVDTFDGEAWVGVVPFRMEGVRFRYTLPVPTASAFPELNVRTYVKAGDRSGVWFFSLDAASRVAVWAARNFFHLPYYDARMQCQAVGAEEVHYRSDRTHRSAPAAEFQARYRPVGNVILSKPGSLEHWLTERYCLFAASPRGIIAYQDVHHQPWPLQPAEVEIVANSMASAAGLELPDIPPLAHFARRLDVLAWRAAKVAR